MAVYAADKVNLNPGDTVAVVLRFKLGEELSPKAMHPAVELYCKKVSKSLKIRR